MLFPVCLCVLFSAYFLLASLSLPFIVTVCVYVCVWLQRKCSGFLMWWSNEKRRGDSAVSAQRPHLLSFFCSLYLSASLSLTFYALRFFISLFIYWVCSLQLVPEYQWAYLSPILHKYPSEEIILDCWLLLWLMARGGCWFDCRLTHSSPPTRGWWWMSSNRPAVKSSSSNWLVFKSVLIS